MVPTVLRPTGSHHPLSSTTAVSLLARASKLRTAESRSCRSGCRLVYAPLVAVTLHRVGWRSMYMQHSSLYLAASGDVITEPLFTGHCFHITEPLSEMLPDVVHRTRALVRKTFVERSTGAFHDAASWLSLIVLLRLRSIETRSASTLDLAVDSPNRVNLRK